MTRAITVLASGAVGVSLGALSARILFGGTAWNLIPWAIIAILIGCIADDLRTALLASAVYGYLLCAVFLYVANVSDHPLLQRVLFALALALVGPICSIAITAITRLLFVRAIRPRRRQRS